MDLIHEIKKCKKSRDTAPLKKHGQSPRKFKKFCIVWKFTEKSLLNFKEKENTYLEEYGYPTESHGDKVDQQKSAWKEKCNKIFVKTDTVLHKKIKRNFFYLYF